MLHPACAEPLTDEWWRGLGGHWPSAKDGRSQLLHDTRLNPIDLTLVPFFSAAFAAKIMPVVVCLCEYGEGVRRPTLHDLVCASQEG
jgi:hypothetical protein